MLNICLLIVYGKNNDQKFQVELTGNRNVMTTKMSHSLKTFQRTHELTMNSWGVQISDEGQ